MPDHELSDAELLARTRTDPAAFASFYERYIDQLLRFFARRTDSAQAAADLAAETFAQALASVGRYRDPGDGSARAWLFTIARRQLGHMIRRGQVADRGRQRLGVRTLPLDDGSVERIEALADLEPLRAALLQALDLLSPDVAAAVILKVAHELPYREVSRRLGCSEVAARARVARGLSTLADLLDRSQGEGGTA